MPVKLSLINKIIITIFILVGINLFGLFNFYTDRMWFGLNTFDVSVVILNIWFFFLTSKTTLFKEIYNNQILKYFLIIYGFILLIIFSMPFRGDISIIDSVRVGRIFLLMPLVFLISYGLTHKSINYYWSLFKFIGIVSALQIFINVYSPEIISSIFSHLHAADMPSQGFERSVVRSKTMLFPHILALFYFVKIIYEKATPQQLFLFTFFFLAGGLQGFRSYFVATALVILIIIIVRLHKKQVLKYSVFGLALLPIFIFIDVILLNNQVLGKFIGIYNEIFLGADGTRVGRLNRDMLFMIPMFLEKPLMGWGFIYHASNYGQEIGMVSSSIDRAYSLYSVDSGYLTMLIKFGVLGFLFILIYYFKIIKSCVTNYKLKPEYVVTTAGFLFIMIISSYTHGALFRGFGLIPLSILVGISSYYFRVTK